MQIPVKSKIKTIRLLEENLKEYFNNVNSILKYKPKCKIDYLDSTNFNR